MLPEQLVREVEELRAEGFSVELVEGEGFANVIFQNYPVPRSYNKSSTELLLKLPMSYPNGKPDMFWTDEDLLLANGQEPIKANKIQNSLGKRRRRFSWHPGAWNPASGNLRMYLEFVNTGLIKAAQK
jgi:hypothetical protein